MTTRTPARLAASARRRLDRAAPMRGATDPGALDAAPAPRPAELPVRVVAAQLKGKPRVSARAVWVLRRGHP